MKIICITVALSILIMCFSGLQSIFVPSNSYERITYDSPDDVLALFCEKQEVFDQVAKMLWNHPDFFKHLEEETRYRRFTNPDKVPYEGYFTEEEWDIVRRLYRETGPHQMKGFVSERFGEINGYTIQFVYMVKETKEYGFACDLLYIEGTGEGAASITAQEMMVSYQKNYGTVSPIDGFENWYSVVSNPR